MIAGGEHVGDTQPDRDLARNGERPGLRLWQFGLLLLSCGALLLLIALYAPWQRAFVFDSAAPGKVQTMDTTIGSVLLYYPAYLVASLLFAGIGHQSWLALIATDLYYTSVPLFGLLLAVALWLRAPRWLSGLLLAAYTLWLGVATLVAAEWIRTLTALHNGNLHSLTPLFGIAHLIRGPLYAEPSTTVAWGFALALVALLVSWVGVLATLWALVRERSQAVGAPASQLTHPRLLLLTRIALPLGLALWSLGMLVLPWITFQCVPNTLRSYCNSGGAYAPEVYVVLAYPLNASPDYSKPLVSPSLADVLYQILFGSLSLFALALLIGLLVVLVVWLPRVTRGRALGLALWYLAPLLVFGVTLARFISAATQPHATVTYFLGPGAPLAAIGLLLLAIAVAVYGSLALRRPVPPGGILSA